MAKAPLEISLDDGGFSAALGRAVVDAGDLTPAMKEISAYLETTVRLRFETETGPGGVPWKTTERKRTDPSARILFLGGDLLTSIRSSFGAAFAEVGSEKSFGAAVYAAIQQFGGIIRPRTKKALSFGGRILSQVVLPARPFVGFDEQDRVNILDILTGFVSRLFGRAPGSAPAAP